MEGGGEKIGWKLFLRIKPFNSLPSGPGTGQWSSTRQLWSNFANTVTTACVEVLHLPQHWEAEINILFFTSAETEVQRTQVHTCHKYASVLPRITLQVAEKGLDQTHIPAWTGWRVGGRWNSVVNPPEQTWPPVPCLHSGKGTLAWGGLSQRARTCFWILSPPSALELLSFPDLLPQGLVPPCPHWTSRDSRTQLQSLPHSLWVWEKQRTTTSYYLHVPVTGLHSLKFSRQSWGQCAPFTHEEAAKTPVRTESASTPLFPSKWQILLHFKIKMVHQNTNEILKQQNQP